MKNRINYLILSIMILTISTQLLGQRVGTSSQNSYAFMPEDATFIGVWRFSRKAKSQMMPILNDAVPQLEKQIVPKGYHDISDVEIGDHNFHYPIWEKAPKYKKTTSTINMNWKSLQNSLKKSKRQYIKNIEMHYDSEKNGKIYTVTYDVGSKKQEVHKANSWNQFVKTWKKVRARNMRLRCLEIYNGKFVGVFDASKKGTYLYNYIGWKNFTKKWDELGKKNYRLVDIETYRGDKGQTHYVGIWHYGKGGYYLWNVYGYYKFKKKFDELKKKGFQLVDLEVIPKRYY